MSFTDATQNAKDSLAKVKVGDMVKVAYVDNDGKLTLNSVAKTKAPTAAKTDSKMSEKPTKPADTKPATK